MVDATFADGVQLTEGTSVLETIFGLKSLLGDSRNAVGGLRKKIWGGLLDR